MGKILICDDEQEILDVTRMILEDAGHQVTAVINSRDVLALITQEQPDVLLIDLWMPALSGDQVVRQVRKTASASQIPIIVISASKDGKAIAYAAGADDFLEKPYDIDALIGIVERQLSHL